MATVGSPYWLGPIAEVYEVQSGYTIQFLDGSYFKLGDGTDITVGYDGTNDVLEFLPTTDDGAAVHIGDGTTDMDFKVFLGSTSIYADFNVGSAQVELSGVRLLMAGTYPAGDGALEYTGTLAANQAAIRGTDLDFENVTGWIRFNGATASGFRYSAYFQPESTGTAKLLGIGNTALIQSGASTNTVEAAQLHIIVNSGATITTRGGDAVAGVHPVWAKVQGDVGATWNSGCRVAPIWSDIQINGVSVSGEEVYHLFCTAGGSFANALIRNEGAPVYFLSTDTGLGNRMLDDQSGAVYKDCSGNAQAGNLVVNVNGTLYGIPLMATA